ncbi:MAG: transposase [Patescibacteria group bacterium]
MFYIEMIEYFAYVYLRSLSLNNTIDIIQVWFEKDILSKDILLNHLEKLIDKLPSFSETTKIFQPTRSGYYAWDGLWFKYHGQDRVLLICFDVVSLDIINYQIALDENYQTYRKFINKINQTEPDILSKTKGFYLDGELGLMKLLRKKYPSAPRQLCVFHKYSRAGQLISFRHIKNNIDMEIKKKVETILFAKSKQEAIDSLEDLKKFAKENKNYKKLKEMVGVLKRNFDLLLTHFDHPEMSPYNNVLEGFNHIIKRRIRLMKGFKKEINIDRWLKLILSDYRFHKIKSSKFPSRNDKSPLELAGVKLPNHFNWMKLAREKSIR